MIRYANSQDFAVLNEHDRHISVSGLRNSIHAKRILVMYQDDNFIGWLRFRLFWDNIPFMNMLYVLDGYRKNRAQLCYNPKKCVRRENKT